MLDFDTYVDRHGEGWVQALIERLERYEGITANIYLSLEERWDSLMRLNPAQQRMAA
jgi:hypothetical protein